ncbi:MAG: aldehyde dehydrogenase family protein, partial [Actinoallomurus sp.]
MDAVTQTPSPQNEPVLGYAPGSTERTELEAALKTFAGADPVDLTCTIGGERRPGGGAAIDVVQPHDHRSVLGVIRSAAREDTVAAIEAARAAAPGWQALPYDERAAVLLRAAELLSGPWRARLNAATMLGQSKTAIQAELDAACELVDFWRFNVAYGRRILAEQPASGPGTWNRMEQRPLEGFVYAITPFNF